MPNTQSDLVVNYADECYTFDLLIGGYSGLVAGQTYLVVFDAVSDKFGYRKFRFYHPTVSISNKGTWTGIGMIVCRERGCAVVTCISNDGTTAVMKNMHTNIISQYVYEGVVGDPIPDHLH